jgi:hypothetical protein
MDTMMNLEQGLPREIEVYEVGERRLYAKTRERSFAIFEDELTPEELIAIAKDIAARRARFLQETQCNSTAA